MKKVKLTKYKVLVLILLILIYTVTIQISSRSILEQQVENMPQDMNLDANTTLFWLNLATIVFALFLAVFQSVIYKFIVGMIAGEKSFSIGFNLYIFFLSILPSSIVIAFATYLNDGVSISENIFVSISSMLLSSLLYGLLLFYYSIIEKRKIILVVMVIVLLNTIINILKFYK